MSVLMKSEIISSLCNRTLGWVNAIRIAFFLKVPPFCFCFKSRTVNGTVNKSIVNRNHNQNRSFLNDARPSLYLYFIFFYFKNTWCIQLNAIHIHLFTVFCRSWKRVIAPCKNTRQKYGWRTARKGTLSSFSWKRTIRPLMYNAWNSNSTARLTKYSNQWVLTCQIGTWKKCFPHVWLYT